MSYWIEIRCSLQNASGCYSAIQVDTPMERTRNASSAAINFTILDLSKQARDLGWTCTKDGWVCPKCKLIN